MYTVYCNISKLFPQPLSIFPPFFRYSRNCLPDLPGLPFLQKIREMEEITIDDSLQLILPDLNGDGLSAMHLIKVKSNYCGLQHLFNWLQYMLFDTIYEF